MVTPQKLQEMADAIEVPKVMGFYGEAPARTPLELAMFAAWVNVDPTQIPSNMLGHTCEATMIAWKRVGEAAVAYLNDQAYNRGVADGMSRERYKNNDMGQ